VQHGEPFVVALIHEQQAPVARDLPRSGLEMLPHPPMQFVGLPRITG
jgi:hypothetical protein